MYQAPRIVSFPVRFALTGFLFYFSAWLWVWKCLNSCPPLFTNKVPTALGQVLIFKTGERFHAFPIYSGNCQSHLGDCSNKKIKVHYGNKESPLLFSTAGQIHVHTLHPPPPPPPFPPAHTQHSFCHTFIMVGKKGEEEIPSHSSSKKTTANKFEIRCGKPIYVRVYVRE